MDPLDEGEVVLVWADGAALWGCPAGRGGHGPAVLGMGPFRRGPRGVGRLARREVEGGGSAGNGTQRDPDGFSRGSQRQENLRERTLVLLHSPDLN